MRSNVDIEDAINRYGDAVLRTCFANLPGRHDAEDAFQDTFVRYSTSETNFSDEDHRKAWLIRVAINICHDKTRRGSSHDLPLDAIGDEPFSIVDEADQTTGRLSMDEAMRELPPDQKTAIMLSVVEGYTASEIEEIMGKPENTVYSYITRGKNKLRRCLGND